MEATGPPKTNFEDNEDCRSDQSVASGIQNDFPSSCLLEFDMGFQKSKADLIERFLLDQAELNRRFADRDEDESDDNDVSKKTTQICVKEINKANKLAPDHQTSGRSRTSIGFYNKAEIQSVKGDFSDVSDVSDSDSETEGTSSRNARFGGSVVQKANGRRVSVPALPLSTLRPKTSIRRHVLKPHVNSSDKGYLYQTSAGDNIRHSRTNDHTSYTRQNIVNIPRRHGLQNGFQLSQRVSNACREMDGHSAGLTTNDNGTHKSRVAMDTSKLSSVKSGRQHTFTQEDNSLSVVFSKSCKFKHKPNSTQLRKRPLHSTKISTHSGNIGFNLKPLSTNRPTVVKLPPLEGRVQRTTNSHTTLDLGCY